jgi:uncharacterized protein (TIGR02284 family)
MTPIEIVDRMVSVCVDSEKRYRHAANDVSRDDLEAFFYRQADLRKSAADELQAERTRMGVVKDESGTFGGVLDRIEMDLSVVLSKGDSGVVDWCRQDAQETASEYEKALRETLPATLRPILERQLGMVRDTISELERVLKTYGGPRS